MRLRKNRSTAVESARKEKEISRARLQETQELAADIERIAYAENHFADAIAKQILKGRQA